MTIAPAGRAARNSRRSALIWAGVAASRKVYAISSCAGAPAFSSAVSSAGTTQACCVWSCAVGGDAYPTTVSFGRPCTLVTVAVTTWPIDPRAGA